MLPLSQQTTLAFAPSSEDLDDIDFSVPIIVLTPTGDDEDCEPFEP